MFRLCSPHYVQTVLIFCDQGSVMEQVDSIYRSTVFNVGYDITGMGFEIAEVSWPVHCQHHV